MNTQLRSRIWLAASIVGIATGGIFYALALKEALDAGRELFPLPPPPTSADVAWAITTWIGLLALVLGTVKGLLRREVGVDLIALFAAAGCLALDQYLAGAVIALMLSSGEALESYAEGVARRELSALLARAPRTVTRYEDGKLVTRPIEDVLAGDRLFVKTGEVIPVDGLVGSNIVLDESALTGESRPVERVLGDAVRSGAVNAGPAFDLRAIATVEASTYAGIVRLVKEAEQQKAPSARLADRYAAVFIPVTLVMAGAAWAISGEAIRGLSVLVVATPCPLLLAVPIAIVGGISRAAKRGIIVKGGGALETLAQGTVLLFDKTGTLTAGVPQVADVVGFGDMDGDELLRLGASLDQVSPHVLATAIVGEARGRKLTLAFPEEVDELHGSGIEGVVDGRKVRLGKSAYATEGAPLPTSARDVRRRTAMDGSSAVFVAVDGQVAGAIVIDDPIRPDTPRVIRSLRRIGIARVVMVTGDHPDVAESVGAALGVDRILSERDPAEKVDAVKAERTEGVTIMVGDGLNDAPALAAADVGVAMGARGATASSEAADIVLVVDRLDRLVEAISIAKRSRTVAIQSVIMGMGLAFGFMFLGAFGVVGPVGGAIVQEFIDVASILNALRALRGPKGQGRKGPATDVAERFRAEHKEFMPELQRLRQTADRLETMNHEDLVRELEAARGFIVDRLPQHEEEEEAVVYPVVANLIGGDDPMSSMARAHIEIDHLARVFRSLLEDLPPDGPGPEDLMDFRRVLYGLHAVLRLHFAQEEEAYAWLASESSTTT